MLRRLLPVIAFAAVAVGLPAQASALTLEEALRRMDAASPFAREIALEGDRARALAQTAGLWDNPDLSFDREEAGDTERITALSLRLPIWGRVGLERDAAGAGAAAAEAGAGYDRLRLRGATRAAFIDLLAGQERVAAIEAGRATLFDLVTALRHREREGESSTSDRRRAEREIAEVDADLALARGRLGSARARLAAVVDLPADTIVADGALATPVAPPPLADLRARAATRGDVVALGRLTEAAALETRALYRSRVPEPSLTVGRKTTESEVDDTHESGPVMALAFPLPLFRRSQPARAAEVETELLRARHEAALRRAEAEIGAAHAAADAGASAAAVYAAAVDAEPLLASARAAYEAGEARILEVLDAYRMALDVRVRRIELDATAALAAIELDLAVGAEVTR